MNKISPMQLQLPKLLACPFCGSSQPLSKIVGHVSPIRQYYYECSGCGCTSPFAASRIEAAEIWNTRSATSEVQQ